VDLTGLVKRVDREVRKISRPLTVAIMGCVVNGPGEAKEADVGIAGGKGTGVLFRRGKVVRKVKEADFESVLLTEINDQTESR
jgi:(E)-4-hydroxy-3-methylbut-2-enyl-diphosphate synthase